MTTLAETNFLVPNATFFVELLGFAILLFVLGRWVVPRVSQTLEERQRLIRQQFAEGEEAQARAEEAEQRYRAALTEARQEAARIREEAKEQGAAAIAEMRAQANAEAQRILTNAQRQLEAEHQQVLNRLRTEVGALATELASRIVGESLSDDARRHRVVERFLTDIEQQAAQPAGQSSR